MKQCICQARPPTTLNPSEKAVLAERPIWPTKTMIPTTRHKKGKKGKSKFQYPYYAGWTDQDWDQYGWYSSHETSNTGQALMAFHDAYEHPEKKAIHGKLIQSDTVSEHNLSVTTNHSLLATKLMAPVINPQHNPTYAILDNGCTRSMGSWHAIQRFTQAIEPMKNIISYQYIPAETKFTFANGETARGNWTLHLRYHTTPPCSTNIDVLEQGPVPILLRPSSTHLNVTRSHARPLA